MAGLSLALLVALGLVAGALLHDDTYVVPPPSGSSSSPHDPSSPPGPQPGLAIDALADFVDAVRTGDGSAAADLAPTGDQRAARRLTGVVSNARRAVVTGFSLRFVATDGAYVDGRWSALVDATWRFAGFDHGAAHAEIRVGLREERDRVAITGFGGGGHVSPLWLAGRLEVDRSPDTLVLVDGDQRSARQYVERAEAAVPVVRSVLPGWHSGLVVEVPASEAALDRTLDAGRGAYDQIAAVTTAADGTTAADAPVHVFVNPDVFDGLRVTGAQVVMSHEATHVATGAFTSPVPLWLLEGFADYVALRDVRLPLSRSAAQIAVEVRKDGPPSALPSAADFGPRTPDLGATYEAAWLAVRLIAQRAGQSALVRCYDAVDAGTPIDRALPRTTGLTVAALTARWRHLLQDLAGRTIAS